MDQHFVYYAIGRRGIKWWRCVFYRLLEMSIVNAYAIHKINNIDTQKIISHKTFRLQLAQSLCYEFLSSRGNSEDSCHLIRGHKPAKYTHT